MGLVVRCAWWLRHLWLAVTTNYARMDSQNYAGVNFLYQRNIEILHEIFPCTTIISHQKLILSNWNDIFEHKCSLFILRSSKQCRSFIRSILSSLINHCLATQPTIVTSAPRATALPLESFNHGWIFFKNHSFKGRKNSKIVKKVMRKLLSYVMSDFSFTLNQPYFFL